jgi:ABC-type amino acid transport substrate-binding protein
MKKIFLALFAAVVALSLAPAASAKSFSFSITGTDPANGSFNVTGTASGAGPFSFAVTGSGTMTISKLFGGSTLNYTTAPVNDVVSKSHAFKNDNLLIHNTAFDSNGLLLMISGNTGALKQYNGDFVLLTYSDNGGNPLWTLAAYNSSGRLITDTTFTYDKLSGTSPAVTPEPSSLLLFGTGVLLLAALLFWKRKSAKDMKEQVRALAA